MYIQIDFFCTTFGHYYTKCQMGKIEIFLLTFYLFKKLEGYVLFFERRLFTGAALQHRRGFVFSI